MTIKNFTILTLIVLLFCCAASAQKKSKSVKKKTTPVVKQTPKKIVFLDINGNEISPNKFREKIILGEFGAKTFSTPDAEKNQLVALEEIVLKDETDKIISVEEYQTKVASNKFNLEPILENNKIIGLRLKAYSLIGQIAPEYSAVTLEEKTITSNSQKGKLTIINFWYIGCIPCMEEIPELNKIVEKYKDNPDVTFLAVSIDSTERLKEFLAKNRFDFQIVSDKSGITKNFQANANGFPTTVIINRNGKIVFGRNNLGKDAKILDDAIKKELSENQEQTKNL